MWRYLGKLTEDVLWMIWDEYKGYDIKDDMSDAEATVRAGKEAEWYLLGKGFIMVSDIGEDIAMWHTLVKPGQLDYKAAWAIMQDVFARFGVDTIVSAVPSFNPRALRAAQKAGFEVTRIEEQFGKNNGRWYDLHCMKITKEVVCQQQSQSQSLQ